MDQQTDHASMSAIILAAETPDAAAHALLAAGYGRQQVQPVGDFAAAPRPVDDFQPMPCPEGGWARVAGVPLSKPQGPCSEWQRGDVLHRHWRSTATNLVVVTPTHVPPTGLSGAGGAILVGLDTDL